MQPGDLLFWPNRGSLFDRLISWRTQSHWVHVEVVTSPTTSIGALAGGIVEHAIDPVATPVAMAYGDPQRVRDALTWLRLQRKDHYSWWDVLAAALPWRLRIRLTGAYDCSALVTEFLELAGYSVPATLATDPSAVTPADLAHLVSLTE